MVALAKGIREDLCDEGTNRSQVKEEKQAL